MVSHGCGGPFFGEKRRLLKLKLDKMDVYLSGDVEKIAAYEAMEAAAAASEGGALPPVPPVAATASAKAKPSADDERPAMQAPTQSQIRKMITKLVTDTRHQMGWEEGLVEVSLHNKSRPVREVERTFRKMNWDFERNKEVPQSRSGAASGAEPKLLDLRKLERAHGGCGHDAPRRCGRGPAGHDWRCDDRWHTAHGHDAHLRIAVIGGGGRRRGRVGGDGGGGGGGGGGGCCGGGRRRGWWGGGR